MLHEPDSGCGDRLAVTEGHADAARRRGVVIEQGAEMAAIRRAGAGVVGVTLWRGETTDAPAMIDAEASGPRRWPRLPA